MQLKPFILIVAFSLFAITPSLQAKTTQATPLKIELGKVYPINYAKVLEQKLNAKRVNDKQSIECGAFLDEQENEHIATLKNLELRVSDKHVAVSTVIGFDNIEVTNDIFRFNKNFKPSDVKSNRYEIFREKANPNKDFVTLENSTIKQPYDLVFLIREKTSDDLGNIFFLNDKLVAVKYVVQC